MINLVSESSVGSTNRRVESLVGLEAFQSFAAERAIVQQLAGGLRVPRSEVVSRVEDLGAQLRAAEKKIAALEAAKLAERVPALFASAERVGSVQLVSADLGSVGSPDDLRGLVLQLRDKLGSEPGVVLLAGVVAGDGDGKPVVIAATTAGARELGIKAGDLAKRGAQVLGGGGGGKPDLAQGGGTDPAQIAAALAEMRRTIEA